MLQSQAHPTKFNISVIRRVHRNQPQRKKTFIFRKQVVLRQGIYIVISSCGAFPILDSVAGRDKINRRINSAVFDNRKIKRFVPEFDCEVSWAEGIRKTIAWFETDPDRQKIDHDANQLWDKIIAANEKAYP